MSASKEQISAFMHKAFPHSPIVIEAVGLGTATLVLPVTENTLRPGGTVSGPTMMALADAALYVAIFGQIGITPLAVTTNLTINFLSKPKANADLIGQCRMLKVGKTQAVGEVTIYSQGKDDAVAHAIGTYALPASL